MVMLRQADPGRHFGEMITGCVVQGLASSSTTLHCYTSREGQYSICWDETHEMGSLFSQPPEK